MAIVIINGELVDVGKWADEIIRLRKQLSKVTAERDAAIKEIGRMARDDIAPCVAQLTKVSRQLEGVTAERDVLKGSLAESQANDRCGMSYLSEIRSVIGGKDFPDMVNLVKELTRQRDIAIEALEDMVQMMDSGDECGVSSPWYAKAKTAIAIKGKV